MTDYSKSCIYKIASKDPAIEDIYIGSTCNLIKRRNQHKSCCNNPNARGYNQYVYQFIRDHGCWSNWNIYIIEQFSCTSKIAKEQVERGYIEELKPTLNKCIPTDFRVENVYNKCIPTDFRVDGVYNNSEYQKQYYKHNRDHIAEYRRQYQIHNGDKIKQAKQQKL